MGSYSLELRELIEQPTQFEQLSHNERIEKGRSYLFDFTYPLFDEAYRKTFETNFIRHFYMREIGFETEGLFKFRLETWLNINMPYYNKLFESELLKYDPLTNSNMKINQNKVSDMRQDDIRNILKNGNKGLSQNDNRDIIVSGRDTTSQTDNRDILKNDNRNINDNINKDVLQNDTVDKLSNEKELNTNKNDSTQDTINKGNTEGTNTSNVKSTSDNTKDTTITNNNFVRDLESTTPDSRLSITTDNGKGVIEYASKIDEKTETKNQIGKEKSVDTTTTDTKDNTTAKNEQTINDKTLENSTENKNKDLNENSKLQSNIHDTTTKTTIDSNNSITDDNLKRDILSTNSTTTGNKGNASSNETTTDTSNDVLASNINNIEDFIQYTFGKNGTVSYPQLVKEYRESFLRLEKVIFEEMNELFMLVY